MALAWLREAAGAEGERERGVGELVEIFCSVTFEVVIEVAQGLFQPYE